MLGMRITSAEYVGSAHGRKDFPAPGLPEIVLVGRSNAGKSSVINSLAHRKHLARTGQTPGVTSAIHFFSLNSALLLADLPGYGFARVSQHERERWKVLIENYLTDRASLALALLIVDGRRLPDDLDQMMVDWLRAKSLPFVVVANKADKMKNSERSASVGALQRGLSLAPDEILLFSAHSGMNRDRLWTLITGHV